MDKKIGIMSMQRIINYGSFLQAYGLKKMIESVSKSEVEFIDYRFGVDITNRLKKPQSKAESIVDKILKNRKGAFLIGAVSGGVLHIIAYTLVRAALYGGRTAIIEIPALTFQTGAGIVIGFVIYMLLKKSGVAGRLSGMLG